MFVHRLGRHIVAMFCEQAAETDEKADWAL
jgi:hypothetical protein